VNFNKIEETIRAKNFSVTYFLANTIKMTPNGFKKALREKTLKVRDLEIITAGLKLPMKYWWEEGDALLSYSDGKDPHLEDELQRLRKQVDLDLQIIEQLLKKVKEFEEMQNKET
jgi:hypothetical protein